MKDYYYFKQKDLLINVQLDNNVATYQTHRPVCLDEMIFAEHYIRNVVLKNSSIYSDPNEDRVKIEYDGPSDQLMKDYTEFVNQNLPKSDFFEDLKFMDPRGWPREITEDLGNIRKHAFESARADFYKKEQLRNTDAQDQEIKDLKKKADQEFCFDRIGDILRDRNEKHSDDVGYRMEELVECVKEYNALSGNKIKITDLIK